MARPTTSDITYGSPEVDAGQGEEEEETGGTEGGRAGLRTEIASSPTTIVTRSDVLLICSRGHRPFRYRAKSGGSWS